MVIKEIGDASNSDLLDINRLLAAMANLESGFLQQVRDVLATHWTDRPASSFSQTKTMLIGYLVERTRSREETVGKLLRAIPEFRKQAGHFENLRQQDKEEHLEAVEADRSAALKTIISNIFATERESWSHIAKSAADAEPSPSSSATDQSAKAFCSISMFIERVLRHGLRTSGRDATAMQQVRQAIGSAFRRELREGQKFEELLFYRIVGPDQLPSICIDLQSTSRLLARLANQLDLASESPLIVEEAAVHSHLHPAKVSFKSSGELFKALDKIAAAALRSQAGKEMVLKISNLSQRFRRLVAFDLEAYEYCNDQLLELGICVFEPESPAFYGFHYILDDSTRNGKLLPDYREHFLFGTSQREPLAQAFAHLASLLSSHTGETVGLVGHNLKSDMDMLATARLRLPLARVDQLDTQILHRHLYKRADDDQSKLETVLQLVGIQPRYLHNAGNDACYTMLALLKMAGISCDSLIK